jgi:hypothetical protein
MSQCRLSWDSPEIKHLDLAFSNLDAGAGLYWAYEEADLVERLVTPDRITWFMDNPPEDTRAWTRAMLLRRAQAIQVDDVDWDCIRFRTTGPGFATSLRTIDLDDPLQFTRDATESILDRSGTLDSALDALAASHEDVSPTTVTSVAGTTGPGRR